jgi:hypothetical protein
MGTVEKKMFKPVVGMASLVGVYADDYPLSYGNYFSIVDGSFWGLYICNFWAENLKEWVRRNPDVEEIEVTVVSRPDGCSIGFISDERLADWCNTRLCITGHGWPSAGVAKKVHELLGIEAIDQYCGCENEEQFPSMTHSRDPSTDTYAITCHHCSREWEATR